MPATDEPSDNDDDFEEMSLAEMSAIADDAIRNLLRRLDPDHVSTGRFVIVADAIDTKTGERIYEPYFLVPPEQPEWETRGLLSWTESRLNSFFLGLYEDGGDEKGSGET